MDRVSSTSKPCDLSLLPNHFKYQMGQLLEQFPQIPSSQQSNLLVDVRNFLRELENICNNHQVASEAMCHVAKGASEVSTDKLFTNLMPISSCGSDMIQCVATNALVTGHIESVVESATTLEPMCSTHGCAVAVLRDNHSKEFQHSELENHLEHSGGDDHVSGDQTLKPQDDSSTIPEQNSLLLELAPCQSKGSEIALAPATVQSDCGRHSDACRIACEEPLPTGGGVEMSIELRPPSSSVDETPLVAAGVTSEKDATSCTAPAMETCGTTERSQTPHVFVARPTAAVAERRFTPVGSGNHLKQRRFAAAAATSLLEKNEKPPKGKSTVRTKRKIRLKIWGIPEKNGMHPDEAQMKRRKLGRAKSEVNSRPGGATISTRCEVPRDSGAVSCRACRCEFVGVQVFREHVCKERGKVFRCDRCNTAFPFSTQLQKHLVGHMRNDCKLCNAHFTNRKALSKHARIVHGTAEPEKYYYCAHCDRKFIKLPSLYAHLKVHAESKIVCMKCGVMCQDDTQYNRHMQKHVQEAKFHCDKCGESFVRRQQYEQHMAGHNKYDCAQCGANFSTKKQVTKHRRLMHGVRIREEKKHECSVCRKRFQRPLLLEIHRRVHTGEKPIQCSHCEKNFRTPKSLARHLKTSAHLRASGQSEAKPADIERSFLCAVCGAKFFRKQGLLRHTRQLHSDERPYTCDFCDYKCKCKTNLKRHVELHKNERRYVCEICGATFHALATLKEHHAYIHSDVRKYVCKECGKGFKGKSGLLRHMRSHSDVRPYVCDCGQSYKRMSHLKRHMMTSHSTVFKSKRIQKIDSEDQSSESLPPPPPYPNPSAFQLIYDAPKNDDVVVSDAITLPITATCNNFLIISDPERNMSEMAREVTLEVTTQVIGQNNHAQFQVPQCAATDFSHLSSDGLLRDCSNLSQSAMLHSTLLPPMAESSDLVAAMHVDGGISETLSIPPDMASSSSMAPATTSSLLVHLPSLNPPHHHHHHLHNQQQSIYETVQHLPSVTVPSSTLHADVVPLEPLHVLRSGLDDVSHKMAEMFW